MNNRRLIYKNLFFFKSLYKLDMISHDCDKCHLLVYMIHIAQWSCVLSIQHTEGCIDVSIGVKTSTELLIYSYRFWLIFHINFLVNSHLKKKLQLLCYIGILFSLVFDCLLWLPSFIVPHCPMFFTLGMNEQDNFFSFPHSLLVIET